MRFQSKKDSKNTGNLAREVHTTLMDRKNTNASKVEQLSAAMRKAGLHRLHIDLVHAKLGRKLTKMERRAYCMACDSNSLKNGAKDGHYARQKRILEAGHYKGARLPAFIGMDPQRGKAPTKARYSESSKVGPIPGVMADFGNVKRSVSKPSKDGLTKLVTHHGERMYPKDVDKVRAIRDNMSITQRHKPESIDTKK